MMYDLATGPYCLGLTPRKQVVVEFTRRRTIRRIQEVVAEFYDIPVAEMTSARRSRSVARPRQVAMYLSKSLTPQSLPDIGRRFGGRDHTTVLHAIRQVDKLRLADNEFDADVDALREVLAA